MTIASPTRFRASKISPSASVICSLTGRENSCLTHKRLSVIVAPSKVNEAFGKLKTDMKKIIVKLETNCEQARAKFEGSMRAFVMRLKFPASLQLTDAGAVLEVETNEMRKIQTEIRARKIAARCVAFGLKEAML